MNRLEQIEKRLKEIAEELNKIGAELTTEDIAKLEKEVTDLQEERTSIKAIAEKRTALLSHIASGDIQTNVIKTFELEKREEQDKFSTVEYRRAFMDFVVRGTRLPAEYRADAVSSSADVGAVIPSTILDRIVQNLEATGMILPLITQTSYKGGVSIPVSSVKPIASWVNESKGTDTQKASINKNGMITFAYHKLRCAVAVSLEVDTMAISSFENLLISNITEAMTKALEQAIISGTGTGQPKGILIETPEKEQALTSTKPQYNDLIQAEAALPQAYESGAIWCMSKKTFMQYYGLTDSNGQPIGRVNFGMNGKPDRTLLGRTVVVCDYVPSFDSSLKVGTKFAFLFNFKDYALNTNYAMGMKKYEDNNTDDMVTKAILLADGKVIDKGSLVTIVKA